MLAATCTALLVWLIAVPLAGAGLSVRLGSGVREVGVLAVSLATVGAALAGWGLLAALERCTSRARPVWTTVAVIVLLLSLLGPLGGVTTAARVSLAAMHVAVAAVLIIGLARTARGRQPVASRQWAALTLVVLAPVSAELTFGAMPLHLVWLLLPLLVPMYGAGVLLIREAVRRSGGGWPSLVLLGLAYELVEDGIGLQALSSPNLYNAASWGPRVLGINTTYWESQVGYHIVFSVLIPIMLTDILFPAHRDRPYLRRGGLVGVGVCAILGVGLIRVAIPPVEDPGYQAPLPVLAGIVLATLVLAVLALRVLPGRTPPPAPGGTAPRPALAGVLAALATAGFLALLLPLGRPPQGPALGHGAGVLTQMALAAAIAITVGLLLHRWSSSDGWDDRHRIWTAGGALVSHTAFGAAVLARTTFDRVGLIVLALLVVVLLVLLGGRRGKPATGEEAAAASPARQ